MHESARVLAGAFLLAACSQNQPPAPPPGATVLFGAAEADVLAGKTTPGFDPFLLRLLWVGVQVDSTPPLAILHVDTITPSGSPFFSYVAAYSFDVAGNPSAQPAGWPEPIDTRPAQRLDGKPLLVFGIPISGTDYVRHDIPGTWKIHVALESSPTYDTMASVDLRRGQ
jgi:hypothetical protein